MEDWRDILRRDLAAAFLGRTPVAEVRADLGFLSLGYQMRPGLDLDDAKKVGQLTSGRCQGVEVLSGHVAPGTFMVEALLNIYQQAGVKQVVAFGIAGALHPDLEVGDVGYCQEVWPGDGMSPYFLAERNHLRIAGAQEAALRNAAGGLDFPVRSLRVYTTGSILAESDAFNEELRTLGYEAIECEAGAVMSLCRHFSMEALIVLVISDSPIRRISMPTIRRDRYILERGILQARDLIQGVIANI